MNQRQPSDINSSFGLHLRAMSIEKASDCHVRNTWIDDTHRQSQLYNDMHKKTLFNYCINRGRFDMALAPRFSKGRCSSDGRAHACLARGTRFDASYLQLFRGPRKSKKKNNVKLFSETKRRYWYKRLICEGQHIQQNRAWWESDCCTKSPRFASYRRRSKHYSSDKRIKDIPLT